MQELWDLFISAQQNVGGIPSKFLNQKKEEIRLKKVSIIVRLFLSIHCMPYYGSALLIVIIMKNQVEGGPHALAMM